MIYYRKTLFGSGPTLTAVQCHSERPTDIKPFGLDRAVTTQKLLLQSTHQNGQ
jgi:hypothetical protein